MSQVSTGSTNGRPAGQLKETERIQAGPGPGRGPFGGGMVGQKANDFGPSAKRLVRRMGPEKVRAAAVVALVLGRFLLPGRSSRKLLLPDAQNSLALGHPRDFGRIHNSDKLCRGLRLPLRRPAIEER